MLKASNKKLSGLFYFSLVLNSFFIIIVRIPVALMFNALIDFENEK